MKELDTRKLFGKPFKDGEENIIHVCKIENDLIQAIFIIDAFINGYEPLERTIERGKKFLAKYEIDETTSIPQVAEDAD